MTLGRALLAWVVLFFVAFTNGVARVMFLAPFLSDLRARQISTLLGVVLLGAAIWILTGVWRFSSAGHAWRTGLLWAGLTVAFEFGFGRFMGHSWDWLLADYAFWEGRLWVLVPLWLVTAPALFHRVRMRTPH